MIWRTRIKICGITRAADALAAEAAGADAVGFVLWPGSQRCVSIDDASEIAAGLSPLITTVGVFVSPEPDDVRRSIESVGLSAVQLCGTIEPTALQAIRQMGARLIRSVSLEEWMRDSESDEFNDLMLDNCTPESPGGTGRTFVWGLIPKLPESTRLWLAGGLNAENVGSAVTKIAPFAVDVSTGVETRKGIKSPAKIAEFIAAVRAADAKLPMNTA